MEVPLCQTRSAQCGVRFSAGWQRECARRRGGPWAEHGDLGQLLATAGEVAKSLRLVSREGARAAVPCFRINHSRSAGLPPPQNGALLLKCDPGALLLFLLPSPLSCLYPCVPFPLLDARTSTFLPPSPPPLRYYFSNMVVGGYASVPNNTADKWWKDPGMKKNVMHILVL